MMTVDKDGQPLQKPREPEFKPTRLEYFSGLAMQGFSANTICWDDLNYDEVAEAAVKQAKALIKQLKENK